MTKDELTQPAYQPMTANEAAEELGVPLSERLQPNLRDFRPKRFVQLDEAKARGWSWCFPGDACRYGHIAARRTANTRICSDCERVKAGEEPIYGKSKAQTFYPEERIARKDPASGLVTAAPVPATPAAPPKPLEPSKKEQDFLAALAEVGDFDKACERVGMTRGQVESRASIDSTFRKALEDLTARHSIPWTRSADPAAFEWTPEIEQLLIRRFIDLGFMELARQELGLSASAYHQRLNDSEEFRAAIDGARAAARETALERAGALADRGKPELLKYLETEADAAAGIMRLANGDRVRRIDPKAAREEMQKMLATLDKTLKRREALERIARKRSGTPAVATDATDDSGNSDLVSA